MEHQKRILIIEDDPSIVNFLSISLKTNGYPYDAATTGVEGLSSFLTSRPDLVLLDLGLPDVDGLTVLQQIRDVSDVPVIVVSARGQEREKVEALDSGADDYITKPFHIGELLARIRVALRRYRAAEPAPSTFTLDGLTVDFDRHRVLVDGGEVHLTAMEYKLLCVLIAHKGKVLTHRFLNREVWGYHNTEDSQTLRVFMANIRRKIERDTARPRYILTEVGVGYRFADE